MEALDAGLCAPGTLAFIVERWSPTWSTPLVWHTNCSFFPHRLLLGISLRTWPVLWVVVLVQVLYVSMRWREVMTHFFCAGWTPHPVSDSPLRFFSPARHSCLDRSLELVLHMVLAGTVGYTPRKFSVINYSVTGQASAAWLCLMFDFGLGNCLRWCLQALHAPIRRTDGPPFVSGVDKNSGKLVLVPEVPAVEGFQHAEFSLI